MLEKMMHMKKGERNCSQLNLSNLPVKQQLHAAVFVNIF
jgi:hypothetical protein